MSPKMVYQWEIETSDGLVVRQYDENGNECTWKTIDTDKVARVSLIPSLPVLPRHDIFIDAAKGEKFIRRFGRGFIKNTETGYQVKEYMNCIVTNKYRLYVFSDGRSMITNPEQEVYV